MEGVMDNTNYKRLWFELKQKIEKEKYAYGIGTMCSMAESVWGESVCEDILNMMNRMENEVL